MLDVKNKYTYLPSYIFKTGSKYKQLTDSYENIFKLYLKDNTKKNGLFEGIGHIAKYISDGFFFSVRENYDSKTNQDKIISAIYYRLSKIYKSESDFKYNIENRIYDIAEESIFYALGIDVYKNRHSYLWTEDSFYKNFIKHVSEVVFQSLVFDFLQLTIESFEQISIIEEYSEDELNRNISSEELIDNSGISWSITPEIRSMIIEYLDHGDEKNMKLIQKYLILMYSSLQK